LCRKVWSPASIPSSARPAATSASFDFDLTSYAFPFTDNAVLPDESGSACLVRDVSELDDTGESKIMRIGLRWFPKNYYPPTERPTDYRGFKLALSGSVKKFCPLGLESTGGLRQP
jgi:hypothetical protein